eukprot:4720190-Alexandrium_andersonii.AAC.1
MGGRGAPALEGAACLSRTAPEPKPLTVVTRDPSRARLGLGIPCASRQLALPARCGFAPPRLGDVEGDRGLALQRGGCCSAPARHALSGRGNWRLRRAEWRFGSTHIRE